MLADVNQCMTGVAAPGGGYKMSGIGREGGMEGLMEYLQVRQHQHRPEPARGVCAGGRRRDRHRQALAIFLGDLCSGGEI